MTNTTLDKAIAAVPKFKVSISLFTKKLRLAQYADGSIYDYRLKIAQAVLFFKKLPEEFTQTDIDYYLSTLLNKNVAACPSSSTPYSDCRPTTR